MMNNDSAEARAGYITGLRQLAALLELHPELNVPATDTIQFFPLGSPEDEKAYLAAFARHVPGSKQKKTTGDTLFLLTGQLAGLKVEAVAWRRSVCERVVVGTETVTTTVKDPQALAAVPEVEVTEEREVVEWRCSPILDDTREQVPA